MTTDKTVVPARSIVSPKPSPINRSVNRAKTPRESFSSLSINTSFSVNYHHTLAKKTGQAEDFNANLTLTRRFRYVPKAQPYSQDASQANCSAHNDGHGYVPGLCHPANDENAKWCNALQCPK